MRLDRDTEVRKLPYLDRYRLVTALETGSAWKQVMDRVRRIPTDTLPCPIKYTTRHIRMVEEAGLAQQRSCAAIFLEEWECSGRKRPTLGDLLKLLKEAELFIAADYVAVDLLKESRPSRPVSGPAAEVNLSVPFELPEVPTTPPAYNSVSEVIEAPINTLANAEQILIPSRNNGIESVDGTIVAESIRTVQDLETVPLNVSRYSPQHIPFSKLQAITNNFNCDPLGENNGRLLGKGAFGSVHLAIEDNQFTAVKRLNKDVVNINKLFHNEVGALLRVEHSNLLRLIAYSSDGPESCLVYEYMSQGDLEERLSCKGRWETPLSFLLRIKIALGISKGLDHLHEFNGLVHRDVKSANILLDKDLVPKLGDFGLVRLIDNTDYASGLLTSTVFGTSVYMAPETFSGEVSAKSDVFSIGVVLLELLTGLSPYNTDGEGTDLLSHVCEVCEKCSIAPLLDSTAGNWLATDGTNLSELLFSLAQDCLEDDKHNRPVMSSVVQILQTMTQINSNGRPK